MSNGSNDMKYSTSLNHTLEPHRALQVTYSSNELLHRFPGDRSASYIYNLRRSPSHLSCVCSCPVPHAAESAVFKSRFIPYTGQVYLHELRSRKGPPLVKGRRYAVAPTYYGLSKETSYRMSMHQSHHERTHAFQRTATLQEVSLIRRAVNSPYRQTQTLPSANETASATAPSIPSFTPFLHVPCCCNVPLLTACPATGSLKRIR